MRVSDTIMTFPKQGSHPYFGHVDTWTHWTHGYMDTVWGDVKLNTASAPPYPHIVCGIKRKRQKELRFFCLSLPRGQ